MNVHQTPFFPTENSKANSGHNSLNIEKEEANTMKEYPRTTSENIHFMLNGDKSLGVNPLNGVRILEMQNHSAGVSTPTIENDTGSIGSTEQVNKSKGRLLLKHTIRNELRNARDRAMKADIHKKQI